MIRNSSDTSLTLFNGDLSFLDDCNIKEVVDFHKKAYKLIKDGLSKDRASTDRLMSELKGAALRQAQKSNIGLGSKKTGGYGTDGGDFVMCVYMYTKGVINTYNKFNGLPNNHKVLLLK